MTLSQWITQQVKNHIDNLSHRSMSLLPPPNATNTLRLNYAQRFYEEGYKSLLESDDEKAYMLLLAFSTIIVERIRTTSLDNNDKMRFINLKGHVIDAMEQTKRLKLQIRDRVSADLLTKFKSPVTSSANSSVPQLPPIQVRNYPNPDVIVNSLPPPPPPINSTNDSDFAALDAAMQLSNLKFNLSNNVQIRRPLLPTYSASPSASSFPLQSIPQNTVLSPTKSTNEQISRPPTKDPSKRSSRVQSIIDLDYWDFNDQENTSVDSNRSSDIYSFPKDFEPYSSSNPSSQPDFPKRTSSLSANPFPMAKTELPPPLPPRKDPLKLPQINKRDVSNLFPPNTMSCITSPTLTSRASIMSPLVDQFDYRFHDSDASMSTILGSGVAGLKNLGNSCYQNSILQCLFGTVPLVRFFTSGDFKGHINKNNKLGSKGRVSFAFLQLMQDMRQNAGASIAPVQFREMLAEQAPYFATREQQDSQEFLTYILDALHEDLKQISQHPPPPIDNDDLLGLADVGQAASIAWDRFMANNKSFISNYFMGQLRSEIQCTVCKTKSVTYAPFSSLSVPIVGSQLTDGLAELLRPEILSGDNAWKCPQCQVAQTAQKSLAITRLPHVLIVHLKRFSYAGPFRNKIDTLVQFPLRHLDLSGVARLHTTPARQMLISPAFDLYAVSNHYGGLDGGHYTAGVRHDKGWLYFDDSRVSKCSEEKIVTNAAYTLFYRQIDGSRY